MTEWQTVKLGDICDVVGGGTPCTKIDDYWNGNIPWLTPKDLSGYSNRYISKGERSITEKGLQNSSAKMLPKGTVLLTSRAPIGYIAIANNDVCTNQGFKSIVLNRELYSPEFFYYLLKNNIDYIVGMASGSTFAEISGTQVKNLEFDLPPLEIQRKIAGILGALDDKIEVLRAQNKTLEQMAQAVFQSWFVDFDIVRAKAAGLPAADVCKKYHITPDIYDLFPSSFSADNLPLGWEKKSLGELLLLSYGKALKENDRIYGSVPVYGSSGQIGMHNESLVKAPGIVVGRKGTVGSVIWCDYDFYPIDTVFYVQFLKEAVYWHFAYFLLKNIKLQNLSGDSAVPGLNRDAAYAQTFVCPRMELLHSFEKEADILFCKIKKNTEQIRTLEQTRDTLLPQLLSGKIEV